MVGVTIWILMDLVKHWESLWVVIGSSSYRNKEFTYKKRLSGFFLASFEQSKNSGDNCLESKEIN